MAHQNMNTEELIEDEETDEVCEFCGGKDGEHEDIATDESDGEGHIMRGVGSQKCPNAGGEDDDYDPDLDS